MFGVFWLDCVVIMVNLNRKICEFLFFYFLEIYFWLILQSLLISVKIFGEERNLVSEGDCVFLVSEC